MTDWLIDKDGDYVAVAHITSAQAFQDNTRWGMTVWTVGGTSFVLPGSYETAKQAQDAFGELMRSFVTEDDIDTNG